ncbi:MAG: hypothetical protein ACLUOI_26085 [Eisenbergiella sp.]
MIIPTRPTAIYDGRWFQMVFPYLYAVGSTWKTALLHSNDVVGGLINQELIGMGLKQGRLW